MQRRYRKSKKPEVRKTKRVNKRSKAWCEANGEEYKPQVRKTKRVNKKRFRVQFNGIRYCSASKLAAAKAAFKAQQAKPKSKEAAALHATLLARAKRQDVGNWAHHLYDVKQGYKVVLDWESIYALSASSPSSK